MAMIVVAWSKVLAVEMNRSGQIKRMGVMKVT
jgi:hypothetical protein